MRIIKQKRKSEASHVNSMRGPVYFKIRFYRQSARSSGDHAVILPY
jgi:hypothetical protein